MIFAVIAFAMTGDHRGAGQRRGGTATILLSSTESPSYSLTIKGILYTRDTHTYALHTYKNTHTHILNCTGPKQKEENSMLGFTFALINSYVQSYSLSLFLSLSLSLSLFHHHRNV